jgi:hypothetical protein
MVARAGFDSVHCVPDVTSWVVPSLRWATAFKTDEPPALTVEGVAVTVREARFWDEGLLHPVIKIKKAHRRAEHTCGIGGIRIWSLVGSKISKHRGLGRKAISKARTAMRVLETRCADGEFCCPMVVTFAYVQKPGNHTHEPLHKFVNH